MPENFIWDVVTQGLVEPYQVILILVEVFNYFVLGIREPEEYHMTFG
jgi:hypothetical protein